MAGTCTSESAFFCLELMWGVAWKGEWFWGGDGGVGCVGRGGRSVMLSWKWTRLDVEVWGKDGSGDVSWISVMISVCFMRVELFLCCFNTG